jgi:DNA-binding CsgD family transcriptional regulator
MITTASSLTAAHAAHLRELAETLDRAARVQAELRDLGWKSSVAVRALDQFGAAVIVADSAGRVIELNRAAERIAVRGDGLTIRKGTLRAPRAFETAQLAKHIATAAQGTSAAAVGRMLVGRRGGRRPYALTVAPLGADAIYHRPLAMVLVADPEERVPSAANLAEFFGFSPAESRLAAAIMTGERLADIAARSGVRITTLRTQLRAVMRRVNVQRQADLVRVLSRIPVIVEG